MGRGHWTEFRQTRISRRKALGTSALAGAGLAVTAACGSSSSNNTANTTNAPGPKSAGTQTAAPASGSAAAGAQPKQGGTIRISMYLNPPHLDILQGNSSQFIPLAAAQDALLSYDVGPQVPANEQRFKPGLAQSMPEQVDPTTLTFKLDPAARWQGGDLVTADDVKFSLELIKNGSASYSSHPQLRVIDSVTAVDPRTVQVKLTQPSAAMVAYLASPNVSIVPAAAYQRLGDFKKEVVGSGPYKLDHFEPNVLLTFVRDPQYWRAGQQGWADRIEWSIIQDDSTRLAAYQAGKHDIEGLYPFLSSEMKDQVTAPDTKFYDALTNYASYLLMNTTKPPFSDERVRKAVQLAINRQQMIATWANGKGKLNGPMAAVYPQWAFTQDDLAKRPGLRPQKDQDLADAKKLLEAAGTKTLSVPAIGGQDYQSASPMLQVARNNLAAVGISLDLQIIDNQTLKNRLMANDFVFSQYPYTTRVDPDDILVTDYHTVSASAWARPKDTTLDQMIDKQSQTLDAAARKRQVDDIQNYLLDKCYYAYTIDRDAWVGYRPAKIAGFYYNLYSRGAALRNTWLAG
jgi:peptide/nickel transport system substrate-binding protein